MKSGFCAFLCLIGNIMRLATPAGFDAICNFLFISKYYNGMRPKACGVNVWGEEPVPNYLEKRRRTWYAVLDVPEKLKAEVGKGRLVKSLGTQSQSEAERLVLPVVAKWKADFEALRLGSNAPLEVLARQWREDIEGASVAKREVYDEVLQDHLEEIHERSPAQAETVAKIVRQETVALQEHLEEWLSTLTDQPKTVDMKRAAVERLMAEFQYTHQINRKSMQRWAHNLQAELATASVQKEVSFCKGYWNYLYKAGHLDREDQPFHEVVELRARSKKPKSALRQPFTPQAVVELLNAAISKGDQPLADLIQLAMWTGCRIEEICSLEVHDVQPGKIAITEAKSTAGVRQIPIHSKLAELVEDLCGRTNDGYLLGGLTFNKYNNRSNAIGKRFGRLKTKQGFGATHVFHSIRKTVATQLENGDVLEGIAADILGHDKYTMSYGLYSGGNSFERLREAIEKLNYPI